MITGNVIGGALKTPNTIILVDEDGNEYTAVATGEEVELTATVDDVREGSVFADTEGIKTGEKFIPSYHTSEGFVGIPDGSEYRLTLLKDHNKYDYTKFQVMICEFNSTVDDSVSVHTVSLLGGVYAANSTALLSEVMKDHDDKAITLGIINNTGKTQILRYFTYKEI